MVVETRIAPRAETEIEQLRRQLRENQALNERIEAELLSKGIRVPRSTKWVIWVGDAIRQEH